MMNVLSKTHLAVTLTDCYQPHARVNTQTTTARLIPGNQSQTAKPLQLVTKFAWRTGTRNTSAVSRMLPRQTVQSMLLTGPFQVRRFKVSESVGRKRYPCESPLCNFAFFLLCSSLFSPFISPSHSIPRTQWLPNSAMAMFNTAL